MNREYYQQGVMAAVQELFDKQAAECATPGMKIRSGGKGRGLARGGGKGPIGRKGPMTREEALMLARRLKAKKPRA